MQGIHTALITPFDNQGDVDEGAFRALCERQIAGGVHGLVPCGTTGETPTLTVAEQGRLLAIAREVAGSRPVTVGIGSNDTRSSTESAQRAKDAGASAGLLVFPYYNKPNPEGIRRHVDAVARVGLPLVLYHVPGRTGQRLSPDLVAEVTNHEGVIALKEATGDLRYGSAVIGGTDRSVLSGDDFTFLGLLAQGGAGCISVVSNVDPAGTVAVYEHHVAGRVQQAAQAFKRIFPLVEFLFSDTNPVPTKALLAALGHCGAEPRLPLASFDGQVPTSLIRSLGLR